MTKEAIRARRTTKTLATVIRRLYERSGVTAEEFARDIGLKRNSLYHLFTGTNGIKYKVLERIERRLGVPTGIILCISHSAALIRDSRFGQTADKKAISEANIVLMANYLHNLHQVLTDPNLHPVRSKFISSKSRNEDLWTAMIDEIMDATQGTVDRCAPTTFTDPQFLSTSSPKTKKVLIKNMKPTPLTSTQAKRMASVKKAARSRKKNA